MTRTSRPASTWLGQLLGHERQAIAAQCRIEQLVLVTVGAAAESGSAQPTSVPYVAIGAVVVALAALGAGVLFLRSRKTAKS